MINQEIICVQCLSKDPKERIKALDILKANFSLLPNKQQAWESLHELTNDENNEVRAMVASTLVSVFFDVPDKQEAWNDLHKLTRDEDCNVRFEAAFSFHSSFSYFPNKQEAWEDLHRLIEDEDDEVRNAAIYVLSYSFSQLPDNQQAYNDLHKTIRDPDRVLRAQAANTLGHIFSHISDKQQAWSDLIKLINDQDEDVRFDATYYLSSTCSQVPDKQQVWNDLHRLTYNQESRVRLNAANALGSIFSQVSAEYEYKIWKDLFKLSDDQNAWVRAYANNSLGKVSIFDASQAEKEEDYKRELENAIKFFEKSSQESRRSWDEWGWSDPSQFCLPFYNSFYAILYKRPEAKKEVEKHLAKAKSAIKGSKSKELLFEVVDILANSLKEIQNLENLDLAAKKSELNFYRYYCERVAEILINTEERVQFTTITLKKGLPILDPNLKWILEEIQERAKNVYKVAKGTPAEYAAYAVNDSAKTLEVGSPKYLIKQIENLVFLLKSYVPKIEENNLILERIDQIIKEENVANQYVLLNNLIPQIINIRVSTDTAPILNEIKELRDSVDKLTLSINNLQNPQEYLDIIQRELAYIKNYVPDIEGKIDEVLYELYAPLSTSQKLKIAIPIIPLLVSYEQETDVPKLVAEKINMLKNLVLNFRADPKT